MRVRKKGNGNDFMFIWCPGSFMVKQMFFSCQWTATIIRDRYTNPEGTGPSSVQGHSRLQLAECLFSSSWYLCNHAAKNWEPGPSFPPRPFPGLLLQTTLNCSFLFQKVCLAFFRCHRAMSTSLPLLWWIGHPDYPWVLVLYSLGHSPICSLQGFWDESACRAFASSSPGRCSSFCLRATAASPTHPSLIPFAGLLHHPWAWGSGFPGVTLHSFGFWLPACHFPLRLCTAFSLPL